MINSFDVVAVIGNIVECCLNNFALTKANVALTLLPVASTLLLVWMER